MKRGKSMPAMKLFSPVINAGLYLRYRRHVRRFRNIVGYAPNIAMPERYHEKMLWRKIFDANPEFSVFCDKLATKTYIRRKCPSLKIPVTLWEIDNIEGLDSMPVTTGMVIKANHGSSFNYFPSGNENDRPALRRLAADWLDTEYGRNHLERGYFGIRRKIFAESLINHNAADSPIDLSIRCSNGKAILISASINTKKHDQKTGYFDVQGNRLYTQGCPRDAEQGLDHAFELPRTFRDAVRYAEILSEGVDYARYDFMIDRSEVYAGEITVYPAAGLSKATMEPQIGYDTICNEHWDLRTSWFLRNDQSGWKSLYAGLFRSHLNDQAALAG